MHTTGWSRGLEVSGGGQGVVSHAGLVLLRHLADKTGLTGGLSRALATPRFLVHDRGRVMADLACAVADGARVISDFRVMSRSAGAVRAGGVGADGVADAGRDRPRRGAGGQADHGGGEYGPPARVGAGRGPARRAARGAAGGPDAGRGDLHPARCHRDVRALRQGARGGVISRVTAITRCWRYAITPAGSRWPGCCAAGRPASNTAADHLAITDAAIAAIPPRFRRKLMVTCDGAGASHALVARLDKLAARRGYELTYSVGWALAEREKTALRLVPEQAWQAAIDGRGEVRERRADDACANLSCAHRACWIEEAHVTELTGLLRHSAGGDQLRAWPAAMRVFARRERPHPGAQLTLFEAGDGWRYSLWATNRPAGTRGWLGQAAYIDAAHRVQARVEDAIRTGKDCGIGHFPSFDFGINAAWLTAAMTGQILLAWLKLLALDGDLAKAEPKTLRYRVLHSAARLVRGGRRRRLKIQATWPWAEAITAAWQRIDALPQAP